jgi:hypothetical protein
MHTNEAVGFYKKKAKEVTTLSMRRASKFNLLSLYGACKCVENIPIPLTTSIYIGSEFGVISGVNKVMHSLNEEPVIVMPVDFLNMNGNNAGFTISKVLETKGENILMMGSDLTFEITLKVAFSKSKLEKNFSALIGGVDESVETIDHYQQYIIDQKKQPYDGSCWMYCNNEKKNALAKIVAIKNFSDSSSMEKYLAGKTFHKIAYNFLAASQTGKKYSYGTQSAENIIDLLACEGRNLAYVSKDRRGRCMLIEIERY